MKAVRIHRFGGPEILTREEVRRPQPGEGEVLVRVKAAGVGPWDAWVRSGRSAIPQPLPLTLGSDIAGVVEQIGSKVDGINVGGEVYGVTNPQFTGGYAEFALASGSMIAGKPQTLGFVEAASIPVVASTAWQMLFDHARVERGASVLIHGAGGNVGSYATQLARRAGARVVATGGPKDREAVTDLGVERFIDLHSERFEESVKNVDAVIDTIGGPILDRSFAVLKEGGALVSSVSSPDETMARRFGVRAVFILVSVTSDGLSKIARLIDAGELRSKVGEVLSLADARVAHEMLAGAPHRPGKIVLKIAD